MRNAMLEEIRAEASGSLSISDPRSRAVFDGAYAEIVDVASARASYQRADELRFGTRADEHDAAYRYLAIAFKMIDDPSISVGFRETRGEEIEYLFHFSGHGLREVGQMNRAADAYRRSGAWSVQGNLPTSLGVRSFARAKAAYAAIGDAANAEEMHKLEWELRRLQRRAAHGRAPLLTLWRVTSAYGTSMTRWSASVVGLLGVFTAAYTALHASGWLRVASAWHFPWTPFYLAVATTLGFDDATPTKAIAQLVVVFNVVIAFALLAIGATILGRKVLGD